VSGGRALAAAVLFAAGCATAPPSFRAPPFPPVPLRPLAAAEGNGFSSAGWTGSGKSWRLRGAALLEGEGPSRSCDLFLRLDSAKGEGRAAFLSESGVKLFEASFSAEASSVAQLAGESSPLRALAGAAAEGFRRAFTGGPEAAAVVTVRGPDRIGMVRREGKREVRFLFGGAGLPLLEKSCTGEGENWSAGYFRHAPSGGWAVPRGVFYLDRRSGFSLTLWLAEVEAE